MRCCSKCRVEKPLTDFHKSRECKEGRAFTCKACHLEAGRKWRRDNPERNRRGQRAHHLRENYGLGFPEVERMWEAQGRKCRSCGDQIELWDRATHIDHDHVSGRVCALLCRSCNMAIGILKHEPERLRKAADYCEQTRTQESSALV